MLVPIFACLYACSSVHAALVPAASLSHDRERLRAASASFAGEGTTFVDRSFQALDVGAGKNYGVFAVGTDNSLDRWTGGDTFTAIAGQSVSRVAVSPNGVPYVVGTNDLLYEYTGGTFVELGGPVTDVGVGGDGSVWAIEAVTGHALKYTGGLLGFTDAGGTGTRIAVDDSGNPYVVDAVSGNISYYANGTWTDIGGGASDVAIDQNTGTVWAAGTDGSAYYYANGEFTSVGGQAGNLSVGAYGVWTAIAGSPLSPTYTVYQRLLAANVYDPPAGTFPYFAGSDFTTKISTSVTPDPKSATWLAAMLPSDNPVFADLHFASSSTNAAAVSEDYTEPVYLAQQPDPVTLLCGGYGCPGIPAGTPLHVSLNTLPENGTGQPGDKHYTIVDPAGGYEYDFYGTDWPPAAGRLTINGGGRCSLTSTSFSSSGCSATGSNLPVTAGTIRVSDLLAGLSDTVHGSLPYAIGLQAPCVDGYTPPAAGSDSPNVAGCAPYGARLYLNLHDADIDKISTLLGIEKVLARTMDLDHYGAYFVDKYQNAKNGRFAFNFQNDLTYTSFGLPGPLVNELVPTYDAEATPKTAFYVYRDPAKDDASWDVPFTFSGLDFKDDLRFACVHSDPCKVSNG